jgi:hypothetical protein
MNGFAETLTTTNQINNDWHIALTASLHIDNIRTRPRRARADSQGRQRLLKNYPSAEWNRERFDTDRRGTFPNHRDKRPMDQDLQMAVHAVQRYALVKEQRIQPGRIPAHCASGTVFRHQ